MSIADSVLAFAVILNIGYVVLSFIARANVDEKKLEQSGVTSFVALTLWWPFFPIYNEKGSRLAIYGLTLFVMVILAWATWWFKFRI